MTHNEMKELEALRVKLNTIPCGSVEWDKAYDRYCELSAKEHEEYKANNIDKLRRFYDEYIAVYKFVLRYKVIQKVEFAVPLIKLLQRLPVGYCELILQFAHFCFLIL